MPIPRFTVNPSRSSFTARRMMPSRSSTSGLPGLPRRAPLDALLSGSDDETIHEDARRVDGLRVELAGLDELLDLREGDLPGRHRHRIEIPRRFPVNEIAQAVSLPGGDHREIPDDAPLQ